MAITSDQAYAIDPNTGSINMPLFKQYASQQENLLANMRANPPKLSAPLQTLQANPELLDQATATVASRGVAPGLDFQSQVEDFAVQSPEQRYLTTNPDVADFAANEFTQRGFTSDPTEYQENFARDHYYGTPFSPSYGVDAGYNSFGMLKPDVNPALMNIARITSGIYDTQGTEDNDTTMIPTYKFSENIPNSISLSNTYYDIGDDFRKNIIGEGVNSNPDMASRDMTKFLRTAYAPQGIYGKSMVDDLGGYSELLRAYDQLGVTGDGNSYADQQVRGALEFLRENPSSINSDGTGGSIDAGTADVGNFSVANAYNAFASLPPSSPFSLALKGGNVLYNMMVNNQTFLQAVSNSLGFGSNGNTTKPGFGFGSESNETGPVGPGFAEGGEVELDLGMDERDYQRAVTKETDNFAEDIGQGVTSIAQEFYVPTMAMKYQEAMNGAPMSNTERLMRIMPAVDIIGGGLLAGAKVPRNALASHAIRREGAETLPEVEEIVAFHGSPHNFDKFQMNKIGTGEGAQAYGHGLYATDSEKISDFYKNMLKDEQIIHLDGKPLDSVYTEDNAENFYEYVAKKIPNATPNETDDLYNVLDNLGQGLRSIDDADAMVVSLTPSQMRMYNKIRDDLYVPEVPEGKTYKVAIKSKLDNLLNYDMPLKDQPVAVQHHRRPARLLGQSSAPR